MGKLYLVSVPIGNLEDVSIRAMKILFSVDIIACEDTRTTSLLLDLLRKKLKAKQIIIKNINPDFKPKLVSFYDEVEQEKTPMLLKLLSEKKNIALLADAGTPLIADPGYKLVRECLNNNFPIDVIPGPSAFVSALILSGLPPDKFVFLGYPPAKNLSRKKFFLKINKIMSKNKFTPTIIFYESPHRIYKTLKTLQDVFGDITIVIARELTKIHQEVIRDKISHIISRNTKILGEMTVVFSLKREVN